MQQVKYALIVLIMTAALQRLAYGQFKEMGVEIGAAGGGTIGLNEASDQPVDGNGRLFLAFPLLDRLQGEIGGGFTRNSADGFRTDLIPLDFRFRLALIPSDRVILYGYAGAGLLLYDVKDSPATVDTTMDTKGSTAFIPAGLGLQWRLNEHWSLDLSGGYNYTFSDAINPVRETDEEGDDSYAAGLLGFRYAFGTNTDADGDGLTKKFEKQIGTDYQNPDTDGDGLNDGEEYSNYKTDPLKQDTDGDELNDGIEVLKYKTNALKPDSDGDGLKDGDEVQTYKTDPLKMDTDAGSVNDGGEVDRGTNPLLADDDVPQVKIEKGQKIVLEGITFKTASSEILPESAEILEKAHNALRLNADIEVEIQGYTDNVGKRAYNLKLSQARAEAVKQWLVDKGIDSSRIAAQGFGPDSPVASNDTPEGRQQNRRIEFARVK